jgi:hypothetical protein
MYVGHGAVSGRVDTGRKEGRYIVHDDLSASTHQGRVIGRPFRLCVVGFGCDADLQCVDQIPLTSFYMDVLRLRNNEKESAFWAVMGRWVSCVVSVVRLGGYQVIIDVISVRLSRFNVFRSVAQWSNDLLRTVFL